MTKLMGQDEAREISYQLPPQGKDTQLGEKQFNVMPVKTDLGSEKQWQMIGQHLSFSLSQAQLHLFAPDSSPHNLPPKWGWWGVAVNR